MPLPTPKLGLVVYYGFVWAGAHRRRVGKLLRNPPRLSPIPLARYRRWWMAQELIHPTIEAVILAACLAVARRRPVGLRRCHTSPVDTFQPLRIAGMMSTANLLGVAHIRASPG